MLQILNRNIKQSIASMREEHPNSKLVIRLDNYTDDNGYLLAVSANEESFEELCEYTNNLSKDMILYTTGEYTERGEFGVLREIK